LVLPGLGNSEPDEIFFIVASTTLQRAEVMLTRIREQLERCPELKASGAFKVSASSLELPTAHDEVQLEKLVLQVAEHVTDTVVLALRRPQNFKGISKPKPADGRTGKRRIYAKAKNSDRRR
jgi:hypothetical protein